MKKLNKEDKVERISVHEEKSKKEGTIIIEREKLNTSFSDKKKNLLPNINSKQSRNDHQMQSNNHMTKLFESIAIKGENINMIKKNMSISFKNNVSIKESRENSIIKTDKSLSLKQLDNSVVKNLKTDLRKLSPIKNDKPNNNALSNQAAKQVQISRTRLEASINDDDMRRKRDEILNIHFNLITNVSYN